jgi:hypothetical protein
MHLKLIACQVFTREFEYILARSPNAVDLELIPMGLHSLGVLGMACKPRLDIAATFARQLVVDVSMKLVFGDGDLGVGHLSGLCPIRKILSA